MTDTHLARLACDEPSARRLAALVEERITGAVVAAFELDAGWMLEIHFDDVPDRAAVQELIAAEAGPQAAAALTFETVAARDWVAASLAGLTPVRAGRFFVHGAHHRGQVPVNAIGIEIEAALAFGTGHHGTTRGCLLALDQMLKRTRQTPIPPPARGRVASKASRVEVAGGTPPRTAFGGSTLPFPGREKKVLDLGTGTGVLAIAAARALHRRVHATDIDPVAVVAATSNARLNRTGALVVNRRADGRNALPWRGPFDLIFANILLGPLTRMARGLSRRLAPHGAIVLSGLLPDQMAAARSAYAAHGLVLRRRLIVDNWATLVMTRGRQ